MSESEIVWQDPPESATMPGQRSRYADFQVALKGRPNQWAILPGTKSTVDSAKGTAMNIRNGRMRGFTKGEFETAVDGTTIYVRYVGGQKAEDGQHEQDVQLEGGKVPAATIRAWAKENGFQDLPERGRLPGHVIAAYEEAHDGPEQG